MCNIPDSQEFASQYGACHSNVFRFSVGDIRFAFSLLYVRKAIAHCGGLKASSVVIILFSFLFYFFNVPCPECVLNYNANDNPGCHIFLPSFLWFCESFKNISLSFVFFLGIRIGSSKPGGTNTRWATQHRSTTKQTICPALGARVVALSLGTDLSYLHNEESLEHNVCKLNHLLIATLPESWVKEKKGWWHNPTGLLTLKTKVRTACIDRPQGASPPVPGPVLMPSLGSWHGAISAHLQMPSSSSLWSVQWPFFAGEGTNYWWERTGGCQFSHKERPVPAACQSFLSSKVSTVPPLPLFPHTPAALVRALSQLLPLCWHLQEMHMLPSTCPIHPMLCATAPGNAESSQCSSPELSNRPGCPNPIQCPLSRTPLQRLEKKSHFPRQMGMIHGTRSRQPS